ncbi:MAG: NAD(P)-dependent alcohol dehydrogenase [Hyphomicrobiaceae bacterium]|nr:NAD(P)-dependent alcohol dehydrogenase [Hyphomicrobiaceae bacterium]
MCAAIVERYGVPEQVRIAAVPRPIAGPDEVLIEVRATAICRGDIHLLTGIPYIVRLAGYGLVRPRYRIPGQNVSGRVVTIGARVTGFCHGDDVFGEIPRGAFAELVSAPARLLAAKPKTIGHQEAAAVPVSGLTALQALRDAGGLRPGQSVLVNGASGGVGTFAVQIAKAMGAEVTAVCHTRRAEAVRALGADRIVDYTLQDFAAMGLVHDVMLDLAGNRSLADCKRALKPSGTYVACGQLEGGDWLGPIPQMLRVALVGRLSSQAMRPFLARPNSEDLLVLAGMIAAGQVRPVVERRFPLARIAEALAHVAAGHVQGTTVVEVAQC